MPLRSTKGFTLIELIAALSVMGFAMLGGVMLLDQLGDSAERIKHDAMLAAREGNGARLLRRVLADASTNSDSIKRFRGDEHGVEFWSRCDVSGGWAEVCRVSLAIDERADSSAILADLSTGGSFSVRRQRGSAEFRYYHSSSGSDSAWMKTWSSNSTLPIAIGLLVPGDTVVFPVGAVRE